MRAICRGDADGHLRTREHHHAHERLVTAHVAAIGDDDAGEGGVAQNRYAGNRLLDTVNDCRDVVVAAAVDECHLGGVQPLDRLCGGFLARIECRRARAVPCVGFEHLDLLIENVT